MKTVNLLRLVAAMLGGAGALFGLFGCVGAEVGVGVESGPVYYGPEYGSDPWFYGGGWIGGRRWDHDHHDDSRVYHAPPLHQDNAHPLPHLPDHPRPAASAPHVSQPHPAPGGGGGAGRGTQPPPRASH